jgi:hypothetical protein
MTLIYYVDININITTSYIKHFDILLPMSYIYILYMIHRFRQHRHRQLQELRGDGEAGEWALPTVRRKAHPWRQDHRNGQYRAWYTKKKIIHVPFKHTRHSFSKVSALLYLLHKITVYIYYTKSLYIFTT